MGGDGFVKNVGKQAQSYESHIHAGDITANNHARNAVHRMSTMMMMLMLTMMMMMMMEKSGEKGAGERWG